MTEPPEPTPRPSSGEASATSAPRGDAVLGRMQVQQAGVVLAELDADAHLHVWEPNRNGDRIDCDLTEHLALLVELGMGNPPTPEPHWTEAGTTLIASLDLGARGRLLVGGHESSGEAATRLAAAGFVQLLRDAVHRSDERDIESEPPGSSRDPST